MLSGFELYPRWVPLTEKGLDYRKQLLERDRNSALKIWKDQLQTARSLISTSDDLRVLQREVCKLETRMEDLTKASHKLNDLQDPEERSKDMENHGMWLHENMEVTRSLNIKICELQSDVNDRVSLYSKRSRRSKSSSKSKNSSFSIPIRAQMMARAARLGAELRFHDIERDKVAALKRQEEDIKKLQIMRELAATNAELEAVTKIEEEEFGVTINKTDDLGLPEDDAHSRIEEYLKSQLQSITDESSPEPTAKTNVISTTMSEVVACSYQPSGAASGFQIAPSTSISRSHAETNVTFVKRSEVTASSCQPSILNPAAPAFTTNSTPVQTITYPVSPSQASPNGRAGTPELTGVGEVITKLADLLTQRQDKDSLPRPEPEVFNGDLLRYPLWIKSFETFIERKTKDPSERLYYLGKFTADEAKESISGLLPLDSEEAYVEAKRILASRFGNPFLVSNAYRKKINDWPRILPNDGPGLRRFSDFLQHCNTAMHSIKYLGVLNDPEENQRMLKKLPSYLVSRWSRIVDKCIGEEQTDKLNLEEVPCHAREATYPSFAEFCQFLATEARIACNPVTSLRAIKDEDLKGKTHSGLRRSKGPGLSSLATGVNEAAGGSEKGKEEKRNRQTLCLFCKVSHDLENCDKFLRLPLNERREFVLAKRLCWGCLKWGHVNKDCRRKKACKTCNGPHPSALHDETWKTPTKEEAPNVKQDSSNSNKDASVSNRIEVCHMKGFDHCTSHSLIVPVWLHHQNNPENKIKVYALLDEQSDACFIRESTLNTLGVDGPEIHLELSTVLAQKTITSKKITGLSVRGINETIDIPLPRTYTRNVIPARSSQIPIPETARKWPHLKEIASHLMPLDNDIEVGLLIGANCARAIKPHKVILGNDDDPYAKKTALGWGIIGVVERTSQDDSTIDIAGDILCNRIVAHEVKTTSERRTCHFAVKTHVKEIISPLQVERMFTLDFNDKGTEEKSLSFEDRRFLKTAKEGIHQREDGHYEMPLPLRNENVELPNNKDLAMSRLMKLKQKLQSDTQYREDYVGFMQETIENGFAERVPSTEVSRNDKRVWYIPHHGVYHKKKPGKIRVVFDCSALCLGQSLNQQLLQGPDLTNNLTGVLCRFRKERVAFMCDIQGMFHQVKVDLKHRDYLRFLWWEDGNVESDPVEFRMTVHLFGATSSPGCANFALKTTADHFEDVCGKEAAEFVRKDFYVDDGLKSVATNEQAINLIKNTKSLCQRGGFRLHKFTSNSQIVISSIPPEDRATKTKHPSLLNDTAIERALGVHWCIESDTLQFRIELKDKPLSRRGILSTVSSVYDPLGLVAPFILLGKRILQELCREGVDWDDDIPDNIRARWEKWRAELPLLERLKVPRCYKPEDFGEVKTVELHHFSDASQNGYGQCSYLRLMDEAESIHCSLVIAKSRVTPLKPVTVPRLELTAALVASKMGGVLLKELEFDQIKETYWTDSKTVLGYINNDARRFHVFVSNRVQEIRERTSPAQWHYVGTKENPADIASRGSGAQELIDTSLWWNGPDFLWKPSRVWNQSDISPSIHPDDPEVKRASVLTTKVQNRPSLLERLEYFSCWHRAKKAVAVCLRIQEKFRSRSPGVNDTTARYPTGSQKTKYIPVNVQELQRAENEIIKNVQREAFSEELRILKEASTRERATDRSTSTAPGRREMKKTSSLYKLDPFLDDNGVLRVGGRVRLATGLTFDAKHPIILPKKGQVTELIVCHHHHSVEHQGHRITHNEIRSTGYWIIGGGSAVSSHISRCVKCQKLTAAPQEQKMADLPEDRLEPSPPFTFSAVDYFGPWFVKEGRKQLKRYGVLFTCLCSRAIHLEVSNTLSTDSFINAYRRFIGRRGPVRQLRSDQGTNFVGAMNELQQALSELNHEQIREELLKSSCDWVKFKMNVPHANHMGGVWERQIRTVRSVLASLLERHGSQLDDESLRTFMVEAEAIVNCRPLTVDSISSSQFSEPLTPNHLLTMKSKVVLPPPGDFQRVDLYLSKRWRRVQYLVNEFWCKWKREFLQSLQSRQKWISVKRNLQVDDVVIVKDDSLPRNRWKLARVSETYPDNDGLVRKVRIVVATDALDDLGRPTKAAVYLERPVQKLVLLFPTDQVADRGIPSEEP